MIRTLTFHADWQCHHSGRCCSSNWPIPVEHDTHAAVAGAVAEGTLQTHSPAAPAFETVDADVLLARHDGRCVFHDGQTGGGCRIHRALGHDALPLACRQFPRVVVQHGADYSVTLSHYCPSAAGLLDAAGEAGLKPPPYDTHAADTTPATHITLDTHTTDTTHTTQVTHTTEAPHTSHTTHSMNSSNTNHLVGLVASPDLPPLLHARCQFGWEEWLLFEELSVDLLAREAWQGLAALACIVEDLRQWAPGGAPLAEAVRRVFAAPRTLAGSPAVMRADVVAARITDVLAAVPAPWRGTAEHALATRGDAPSPRVAGRLLAAHAFANWTAYSGRGLRAWYRSIEGAAALLAATGDVGAVDLVLRHLADSSALIARWNQAEAVPLIPRP
ncbi:MAG: YkgJ family cysteine cluster protein [Vicinamibacterales bacterium]